MKSSHAEQDAYLGLTIAGAVVPMVAFVPWVVAHGLDVRLLTAQLFANRVSTFFGLDLLITGCVVAIYARSALSCVWQRWLVIFVMLCVGVSAALPLLLYFRVRAKQTAAEASAI